VVIAGQPNAGKSSLLNALAGAELAIVTPIAGTTRDKVSQLIQIEGVPLHVVDTAGLREALDEVEKIGVERAWAEIASADAVLFLHDLTRHAGDYLAADAHMREVLGRELPRNTPIIDVWNKSDAAGPECWAPISGGVRISAKTGDGLQDLRRNCCRSWAGRPRLKACSWRASATCAPCTRWRTQLAKAGAQLHAARPALDLLAEDLRQAQLHLSEITGAFTPDDLLGEIFSRFCIGK
jgi:tRNA modification GTPase